MMKKISILFLVMTLLFAAAGCSSKTKQRSNQSEKLTPSDTILGGSSVNQENSLIWDEDHDNGKDKGYTNLSIVGVDEFGRIVNAVKSEKSDKAVGIFYGLTQGSDSISMSGIYNVTDIIKKHGVNAVFKDISQISPVGADHWWDEPLYGYYSSADSYVIKKHMEQFTAAGIDYIVFDTTNARIYSATTKIIMKTIVNLREQGWDAPQVVYYCHSFSNETVRNIYDEIYSKKEYEEAWYKKDGKPVIIAYTEAEKDKAEAATRGVTSFEGSMFQPLSQEILDFFCFVEPRWPSDSVPWMKDTAVYDVDKKTGFCWIEWTYPLPERTTSLGTFTNVAVASHPNVPFSFSITRELENWGRNFDPATRTKTEEGLYEGTYFQKCWDQALALNSDNVFLVAWNFWTALKTPYDGEYMLCDTATLEFSLTIEMSKGNYKDAYYIQMIENMRRYKYDEGKTSYTGKTIDISGGYGQWYDVDAVYRQIGKETYERRAYSADGSMRYRLNKPKNNVQEVRVSHDKEKLYFMIRTEENITPYDGSDNWMNLFIGTGEPSIKGWNSYEYVLNRSVQGNTTDIIKLKDDFTGEKVGSGELKIIDNFMFLSIPRDVLDLSENHEFYFKVTDSVETPEDIMEYYRSGSVIPTGRLAYNYTMKVN
jgi:hypothetical protein